MHPAITIPRLEPTSIIPVSYDPEPTPLAAKGGADPELRTHQSYSDELSVAQISRRRRLIGRNDPGDPKPTSIISASYEPRHLALGREIGRDEPRRVTPPRSSRRAGRPPNLTPRGRLNGKTGMTVAPKDRRNRRRDAEQVTGDASDIWPYRRKRHLRWAIIFHYALTN